MRPVKTPQLSLCELVKYFCTIDGVGRYQWLLIDVDWRVP